MSPEELSRLSIEELLRLRDQEKGAWEELLRRAEPELERRAKGLIGRSPPAGIRASDVCQEARLSAFQRIASFRGKSEGEWWKWFDQILESRWLDMARHATRQKRDGRETLPLDAEEVQALPAIQNTPSQISAQQEDGRRLMGYILELPDDQREALSLFLLRGASVADLMDRSGRSQEALDSLLRRGMRTLLAKMEGRKETEPREPHEIAARNQADAALAIYFRRIEAGVPMNPDAFAADYPDCADELRGVLRQLETLRALRPSV